MTDSTPTPRWANLQQASMEELEKAHSRAVKAVHALRALERSQLAVTMISEACKTSTNDHRIYLELYQVRSVLREAETYERALVLEMIDRPTEP